MVQLRWWGCLHKMCIRDRVMTNLMQYVDVCIGNEEDAEKVLGFKPGNTDVTLSLIHI